MRIILLATILVVTGAVAGANEQVLTSVATAGISESPDAYGSALSVYQVGSYQFQARDSFAPLMSANGFASRYVSGGGVAIATPTLPTGATVERVEFSACDSDPNNMVIVVFGTCSIHDAVCTTSSVMSSGITPGCTTFSAPLNNPVGVSNSDVVLWIQVVTGPTANTTFQAVNLYYRLRVSQAPAVATFGDVPVGHPQRQFIEALASAGITGGCGGGNYCPDNPLTRGEMAVFLATALGLHFPN